MADRTGAGGFASPVVWDRTHRFAAWSMMSGGVIGFVLVLAGVFVWLSLVVLLIAALSPVIYSVVIYKKSGQIDQDEWKKMLASHKSGERPASHPFCPNCQRQQF